MNIKIYEMFMRDGLQSLNKIYSLQTKLKFMNLLNKCNFYCIEFGSTTSPKLLPQMANSYELFDLTCKNLHTKYTMLVPSYNHIQKTLDKNINSFGLVCSVSEVFAQKNLKKTSDETFDNVVEQIELLTNNKKNLHIRVYLSCSFGSPWENFNMEYFNKIEKYINNLIEIAKKKNIQSNNFDIVISDTVGLSNHKRTNEIMKIINDNINNKDVEYLATHIHSKEDEFYNVINNCIKNNIVKFDSSIAGIGGCPFAEDKALGNISTVKLIEFLNSNFYYCSYDEYKTICNVEKEIKQLLLTE
jgi:hydroxymethylglutaryl-CoA lyase